MLVDLHGQHAHQSLRRAPTRSARWSTRSAASRRSRARRADAWRAWRAAVEQRDAAAAGAAQAIAAERELLDARRRELAALGVTADEWTALSQAQIAARARRGADRSGAPPAKTSSTEADGALAAPARRADRAARRGAPRTTPRCGEIVALLEPARIQLDEAARELRAYRAEARSRSGGARPRRGAARRDPRRRAQVSRAARSAARAAGGNRGAARGARASRPTRRARASAPRPPRRPGARSPTSSRKKRRFAAHELEATRHGGDAGARDERRPLRDRARCRSRRRRATAASRSNSASRAIRSSRWGRSRRSRRAASCRGSRSRSRS